MKRTVGGNIHYHVSCAFRSGLTIGVALGILGAVMGFAVLCVL